MPSYFLFMPKKSGIFFNSIIRIALDRLHRNVHLQRKLSKKYSMYSNLIFDFYHKRCAVCHHYGCVHYGHTVCRMWYAGLQQRATIDLHFSRLAAPPPALWFDDGKKGINASNKKSKYQNSHLSVSPKSVTFLNHVGTKGTAWCQPNLQSIVNA